MQAILSKNFNYNIYTRCIYSTNFFKKNIIKFTFNPNYASKIDIMKFYFLTPKEAIIGKQGQSISSKS